MTVKLILGFFVLSAGLLAPALASAARFCPGIHSRGTESDLSRARYWSMPSYQKAKLLKQMVNGTSIPGNLRMELPMKLSDLSTRAQASAKEIFDDLNYRVGFFNQSQLRFQVLRDTSGDAWAFLVQRRIGDLRPENIAVYSVEQSGGRKVIQLIAEFSDAAIL